MPPGLPEVTAVTPPTVVAVPSQPVVGAGAPLPAAPLATEAPVRTLVIVWLPSGATVMSCRLDSSLR